jgi:FkbM family methyltransferase
MFRNIANKLIALYLFPMRCNLRLLHYVKGVFFSSGIEHLYWSARYIKRQGPVPPDAIIIDVGGFDGGTSLYFASEFKEQTIYCFEPNARMSSTLDKIAASHKTIRIRKIALGNKKGSAVLHVTANDVSSSLNEISVQDVARTPSAFQASFKEADEATVEVSTLDQEFKDSPDVLLIKLDTQGTELDVLSGGTELLKKTRFVLTEMDNHHLYKNTCQYYEVDDFLRSRSFKLVDIIVSYRGDDGMAEFDALYENMKL